MQDWGQTLLFDNPQKSHESVHFLTLLWKPLESAEDHLFKGIQSGPPMTWQSSVVTREGKAMPWLQGVGVEEFVLKSYPVNNHMDHRTSDDHFRFRLNSISSLIAMKTRRGAANLLLIGPDVWFGPLTWASIKSDQRLHQIARCDWLPRHHILVMYSHPIHAFDQPFVLHDNGIVVNDRFDDYGCMIHVPPSQQA